jgi:hypothetical protein
VADDPNKNHSLEALKFYFEFFKHFTTLTTAAALIVLALSEQLSLGLRSPVAALAFWGITLSQALLGMVAILSQLAGQNLIVDEPGEVPGYYRAMRILSRLARQDLTRRDLYDPYRAPDFLMWLLMVNTTLSFIAGLLIFVIGATGHLFFFVIGATGHL